MSANLVKERRFKKSLTINSSVYFNKLSKVTFDNLSVTSLGKNDREEENFNFNTFTNLGVMTKENQISQFQSKNNPHSKTFNLDPHSKTFNLDPHYNSGKLQIINQNPVFINQNKLLLRTPPVP